MGRRRKLEVVLAKVGRRDREVGRGPALWGGVEEGRTTQNLHSRRPHRPRPSCGSRASGAFHPCQARCSTFN